MLNVETARPLHVEQRNRVLMIIYTTAGLMEGLLTHYDRGKFTETSALFVCKCSIAISKVFVEPRESIPVKELAKLLRERDDVPDAKTLCAIIKVEKEKVPKDFVDDFSNLSLENASVTCWATDKKLPGDRHNDDFENYRDIKLIPTLEELNCAVSPCLPLFDGENDFVEDPDASLLDRQFRLLREDTMHTIKTNISECAKP